MQIEIISFTVFSSSSFVAMKKIEYFKMFLNVFKASFISKLETASNPEFNKFLSFVIVTPFWGNNLLILIEFGFLIWNSIGVKNGTNLIWEYELK